MRHGRKSRSVIDGYKRHVLRDLDRGVVPAVGITPANVPEAHGDRQYRGRSAPADGLARSCTSTAPI